MALDPAKVFTLRAEITRLVAEAKDGDTSLDVGRRISPGPLTDDEWVEFVAGMGRIGERSFTRVDRESRRLVMTARERR